MNRQRFVGYTACLLLSLGIHALVFLSLSPELTPAKLELQEGQTALQIQMKPSMALEKQMPEPAKVKKQPPPEKPKTEPVPEKPKTEPVPEVEPLVEKAQPKKEKALSTVKVVEEKIQQPPEPEKSTKKVVKVEPELKPEPKPKPEPELPSDNQSVVKQSEETTQNKVEQQATKESPAMSSLPEGIVKKAKPRSSRKPRYPRKARLRHQEGLVVVELSVGVDGKTSNVELVESSGYRLLDKSVLSFVRKEKFEPAKRNGVPVETRQRFPFRFVLTR